MKWIFGLLLMWFVLSIFFPSLRPHHEPSHKRLMPVRTVELPPEMVIGDVIQINGADKAELLSLDQNGFLMVRYVAGKRRGVIDAVRLENVKPLSAPSTRFAN